MQAMDATLTQNLGQLSIIDAGLQTPPTQSFSHGEANGSMDEDQLRNANEYIAELKKKLHCFGVTGEPASSTAITQTKCQTARAV